MYLTGLNFKPVGPKEKQSSKLVEEKNVQVKEGSSSESSSKGCRSFSDAGKGESKSCDFIGKCEGGINEKRTNILNAQRKPSTCEAFEIEDVSKSGTTESPNLGGCELLEEEDKEAYIACAAATKEAQGLRCTMDYPNTNFVDLWGQTSIVGDGRCFSMSNNKKVDMSNEDEVHGLGGCYSNRNLLENAPIDLKIVKELGGCNLESERPLSVDSDGECESVLKRRVVMGKVDLANGKIDAHDFERKVDLEQECMFPELSDYKFRRKYASIAEIQDKALSIKEKRKRDRALKSVKRRLGLFKKKEARVTLELGKKLGVEFVGDEEEVVVELVRIEMESQH
ncbi:hypothetical protein V6N11_050639 [Hibiscus sabdariffa]|uniref:Uncharacterized protein n=2 Tax=Hibiscus sabdariffa TaxID=183260 RepID=A0ABR2BX61_9ROSI